MHGLSGLAVTLSGLYKITEENKYVEKIIELLNNENKLYSENQNVYSWCKGKTGVILARHIISTNCTNNYSITKYIENCSPTFSQDDEKFINHINEYGLCHGLYGILDILNECKYDQFNEQIYTKYFDSLLDIKWFEHSEYKQESFMTGAAGVAYALMRIYNKLPSTLSLDIYS